MLYFICFLLAFIPLTILLPTTVKGRNNIPRKGKVLLACNHKSGFDVCLIAIKLCRRRYRYMAKKELFENKFAGWILRKFGAYPVNRGGNDLSSIKTTFKYLAEGKAICIFPEGHRIKEEFGGDVKNGLAMISLKTKTPIVPCVFKKKPRIFCFNKMIVGQPIYLYEMDQFKDKKIDKELLNEASNYVTSKFDELRSSFNKKEEENND